MGWGLRAGPVRRGRSSLTRLFWAKPARQLVTAEGAGLGGDAEVGREGARGGRWGMEGQIEWSGAGLWRPERMGLARGWQTGEGFQGSERRDGSRIAEERRGLA